MGMTISVKWRMIMIQEFYHQMKQKFFLVFTCAAQFPLQTNHQTWTYNCSKIYMVNTLFKCMSH